MISHDNYSWPAQTHHSERDGVPSTSPPSHAYYPFTSPSIGNLNASARPLDDHVVAMHVDKPRGDSFQYRVLKTPGFSGVHGDGTLNALSLAGELHDPGSNQIRLWFVNLRPSINASGTLLDNTLVGANNTIELFEMNTNADEMQHVRTFAHPLIATPSRVAPDGRGGVYFTNDHGTAKAGWRFKLSPLLHSGDVTHCTPSSSADDIICTRQASGYAFPNGLLRSTHSDNNVYVPGTMYQGVSVYSPSLASKPDEPSLKYAHHIPIDYPIDNISQDQNGDLYLAVFPKLRQLFAGEGIDDPNKVPTSAVIKISKKSQTPVNGADEYEVTKVIEDRDGEILPGTTTAVHDAKTGRLWLVGVSEPFITVCDPI